MVGVARVSDKIVAGRNRSHTAAVAGLAGRIVDTASTAAAVAASRRTGHSQVVAHSSLAEVAVVHTGRNSLSILLAGLAGHSSLQAAELAGHSCRHPSCPAQIAHAPVVANIAGEPDLARSCLHQH